MATRAAAIDRIDELLAEVKAEASAGAGGPTMSALLDEFERAYFPDVTPGTRGAYRGSIAWFRKCFVDAAGDPRAADVGKADVSRYLDWRRVHRGGRGKGPVSQRTLRKDYATLHTVFEWAREDREYVATNPVTRRLKLQRGDERQANILTADQVDRLLRACAGRPMLSLFAPGAKGVEFPTPTTRPEPAMPFDQRGFAREIGLRLAARRKGRFTQDQIAAAIGIPRGTYASIEGGRQRITVDVLWRAAVVLECPLTDLVPEPIGGPGSGVSGPEPSGTHVTAGTATPVDGEAEEPYDAGWITTSST